jgi:hypothetical protein
MRRRRACARVVRRSMRDLEAEVCAARVSPRSLYLRASMYCLASYSLLNRCSTDPKARSGRACDHNIRARRSVVRPTLAKTSGGAYEESAIS